MSNAEMFMAYAKQKFSSPTFFRFKFSLFPANEFLPIEKENVSVSPKKLCFSFTFSRFLLKLQMN
jgi:hypothetical protein